MKKKNIKGNGSVEAGKKYPRPPAGSRMWKHAEDKRQHTWWCRDDQWKRMSAKAADMGRNVTSMLTGIADGEFDVVEADRK